MSTTAPAPTRSSTAAVLDRAVAAVRARRRVEVEVLESALAWAHAHVVSDEEVAAGWRSETIHAPGSAAALFGERPLPIVRSRPMAEKRRGLGRGIGALIPTIESTDRPSDIFFTQEMRTRLDEEPVARTPATDEPTGRARCGGRSGAVRAGCRPPPAR